MNRKNLNGHFILLLLFSAREYERIPYGYFISLLYESIVEKHTAALNVIRYEFAVGDSGFVDKNGSPTQWSATVLL